MARAMWLALAFAALASGARYVDYSESKMPEYGGAIDYEGPRDSPAAASEDYHDRFPDVPASLDYDETGISEKPVEKEKDVDDSEEWQKSGKKHRKSLRSTSETNVEPLDKYNSDEIIPNIRPNHRFIKYRPRLKYRSLNNDELLQKRPIRYGRYRKEVMSGVDSKDVEEIDDFKEDKVSHRVPTTRIARRKPREKLVKADDVENDELVSDVDLMRKRFDTDYFLSDDELQMRPTVKRPLARTSTIREEADFQEKDNKPVKPKKFDEYSDYYDMKRVQGIKEKLPVLLRRTTTSLHPTPTPTWNYLWTHRRQMIPLPEDIVAKNKQFQPDIPEAITTSTTEEITSRTTRIRTTTTTETETSSTSTPIPTMFTFQSLSEEAKNLSIAEKSRLSILKKAQRKEMKKLDMPNKPPVLMQVTDKMYTVVMVEPPGSDDPLRNAKVVHEDTKHNLDKVKRLMRQKFVANAKNIHDLTDNWDDMVCDFIDVDLIKDFATVKHFSASIILLSVLINIF